MKLPFKLGSTSDVPEALPMGPTSPNADRDTALDHDPAAVGPARPAEPTGLAASEVRAEEDVDASIAAAREGVRLAGELQPVMPPAPEDPLAWARRLP